jgi:hypothetical protein
VTVWPLVQDCGSPFVFPVQIRSESQEEITQIQRNIMAAGVEIRSLMGGGIHEQPAWSEVPHDGLKRCQAISKCSFFVGIHQTLPDKSVEAVGSILRSELKRVKHSSL